MSQLNVDNIQNRTGSNGGPNFPSGIRVAVGQTAYIHGNLQVDGTETIINTETLNVSDKTVGIGSTSNASNTTADGSGIEIFASSSQTGNNKTITWSNTSNSWEFGPNDVGLKVGTGITVYGDTGIVSATSFKGDGSELTGIDATALKDGSGSVKIQANSDGVVITGVATVGVLSATTLYGSGANLTNLPPGGNVVDIVADGAIGAGKPCIVTSGGKAKQVGLVFSNPGSAPQNSTEGDGTNQSYYGLAWSPQRNRVILAQSLESGNKQGSAKVFTPALTFSTNSLTGGTDQPFDTSDIYWTDCAYDPDTNQTIFVYRDDGDSGYGKCVLGTLSGGSYDQMTYGSIAMFESNINCKSCKVVYDTHNDKVIVVWTKGSGSGAMRAAVGTVSGTSITFGAVAEIGNSVITDPGGLDLVFDASANKAVCIYHHAGDANRGYAAVLTVSGTNITWETPVKFAGNQTVGHRTGCFDANSNKLVVVYRDESDNGYGKAVVGTVSGTSVTFGTPTAYPGNIKIGGQAVCYDPSSKDIFIFGAMSNSSNHGRIIRGTVSGNSISIFAATTLTGNQDPMYSDNWNWALVPMNTGNSTGDGAVAKIMGVCRQQSHTNMKFYTFKTQTSATNINNIGNNVLGFPPSAINDGDTGTINLPGNTVDSQSGLTAGSRYYVQDDGTLSTTFQTSRAGVLALSATKGVVYGHDT